MNIILIWVLLFLTYNRCQVLYNINVSSYSRIINFLSINEIILFLFNYLELNMDTTNSLITAGITAGIVAVLGAVYKLCHHCRFRSSCCGRELKIDSNLSPPAPKESFDVSKKEISVV